ncbi:ankyrin repeat domain-containing protein [Acinetobacter gerneri]|uniref:Uncharacterized protein n=1 Tax=Acinetobacter gerneri DSM 14967 = CIP 107464 = MTCC 9824 TaxID=1120926 RepID=N8Y535_9GAMM|nr:hypothetical protein F960_04226 [Acinetobacter gerneri DSM 14967 = CIP 107464 = MTCC 9824]EPR82567.1 AnkB protein [Acinetobacter gerneri DSM 14967 = CIP 107464 = MTCC 9824]
MKELLNGLMMSLASILIITVLSLGIGKLHAKDVVMPQNTALSGQQKELIDLFFAAAKTGQVDVVDEFLNHGFPVDIRNDANYTALMMASYYGQQPVVSSLLKHGANRCLRDNRGHTALMGAIVKAEWTIAKQLRKEDCDKNADQSHELTVEEFARVFGQEEKLRELSK